MLATLFACLTLLAAGPAAAVDGANLATCNIVASTAAAEEKALKALQGWLKHYRSGKMPLLAKNGGWQAPTIDNKDSYAVKFGLAPKAGLGNQTWAGDLEVILEHVAKLDTPEAAQGLLEVAAIGMDAAEYSREMAPYEVRAAGERWLRKLVAQPARDEIKRAANGELKFDKARSTAIQIAAVRWLGSSEEPGSREILERSLAAAAPLLRFSAAEALGKRGEDDAGPALAKALEEDPSDLVLPAIATALRKVYAKHQPSKVFSSDATPETAAATLPESVRVAVQAAAKALGRATWRSDLALIDLIDDFRSKDAMPALIAVLERFRDNPQDVQSGRLSGLLLHRAHEVLVSMTGAIHPANQPDKWRELWERDKDKIEVGSRKPAAAGGAAATSAGDFCGIPVQGTRVLFILDLSGSMSFPMPGGGTRLDFAKRELIRAMEAMAPNAWFNLITFNGNPKPKSWNKEMVQASDKHRERFRKHVNELRADGGTNLWCALEEGMKFKSVAFGDRYESNVDEMFVLSDGAPSVGDVVDPIEILRLVKESNRFAKMRIHTIYISSREPQGQRQPPWMSITPEEMMKRMAEENGGKFVNL